MVTATDQAEAKQADAEHGHRSRLGDGRNRVIYFDVIHVETARASISCETTTGTTAYNIYVCNTRPVEGHLREGATRGIRGISID
jgi:hypothetical protein